MTDATPEEGFGLRLRVLRKAAGLSQQTVADLVSRPQSFVSKAELGNQRICLNDAAALCDALGVPLASMVSDTAPDILAVTDSIRMVEDAVRRRIAAQILAGVDGESS
jgi:transcriptional regulator with XRE-family HTH domain